MTTIQVILLDALGAPLSSQTVRADLVAGPTPDSPGHLPTGEITRVGSAITDADGLAELELEPNSDITPADTFYRVWSGRSQWYIEVPAVGGPYLVGDPGIAVITPVPPGFVTGGSTPTGSAGGHLTGTYPNPQIAAGVVTEAMLAFSVATQAELDAVSSAATTELAAHIADTTAIHGITDTADLATDAEVATAVANHAAAADPHTGYLLESIANAKGDILVATANDTWTRLAVGTDGQVLKAASGEASGLQWAAESGGGGGGAPTDVDYLVGTASGSLSAEIVVGTSPGGELGGTWASPTVDATHSGSAHADYIAKAFLDAKGNLISASADNTPALLAVGTNDHVLMAASGEATGLKWGQLQTAGIGDAQVTAAKVAADVATQAELDAVAAAAVALATINAKGDLLAGTADNTLARLGVGSNGLPLVAASGETTGLQWAQLAAGGLASDAVTTVKILDANVTRAKLANDTRQPRVTTSASEATPTPNVDTTDHYQLTAQAAAAAFAAPTGTPANGQNLVIRIKDNGTARALTWNAIYRGVGATLPTTTVVNKTLYVGCRYNSADTKWDVLAVNQEA